MLENFLQLKDQHLVETFGDISMNEYQQMVHDLAKPGADIIKNLDPALAHTLHMAIGLVGEVAELKEHQLEKITSTEHSTVLEELGDIEFYFEGLCQSSIGGAIPTQPVHYPYPLSVDHLVVAAGQVLDLVKKMAMYEKETPVTVFVAALIKVRECMDQVYSYYGLTAVQAREHNLKKLLTGKNARYKEGTFSNAAAQTRRDKVMFAMANVIPHEQPQMLLGPTEDIQELLDSNGDNETTCILRLEEDGRQLVVAEWDADNDMWGSVISYEVSVK